MALHGCSGRRMNGAAKVRGGAAWLKQRFFGQQPGGGGRLGSAHSGAFDSDDSEVTPNSRSHATVGAFPQKWEPYTCRGLGRCFALCQLSWCSQHPAPVPAW